MSESSQPISGGVSKTPSMPSVSFEYTAPQSTSKMSKEERRAYGESQGLSGEFLNQYVNTDRTNPYLNTFWDRFRKFFGGKLGSESMQESLDLKDSTLLNELLNAQREFNQNSPEQQVARERAAGLNPDLDPGSIQPGEAPQIDDEVFGAGLQDQLASMNNEPGNFQSMASVLMDGATSVLGLLSGGAGLASSIMSLDSQSISDLLNFSKFISELTFDPTSPQYKEFVNEDGEIKFEKIGWDKFPLFSSRYRRVYDGMRRGLNSPESKARRAEAARRYTSAKVGTAKDFDELYPRGLSSLFFADSSDDELYPFHFNAVNQGPYREYVNNVSEFVINKLKGDVEAQKIYYKYQKGLSSNRFADKKAAADAASQELSALRSRLQTQAGEQVKSTFERLLKESQDGSWISTLLLQSIISGSFNQFGLGDPGELPFKLGSAAVNVIPSIIKGFIPGM